MNHSLTPTWHRAANNPTRLLWVDAMRGICMIAILLYHTEIYYTESIIIPYQFYVHDALSAFFFLSGYLFVGNNTFSFRQKLTSIIRTLLVPYFVFTLFLALIKIALLHYDAITELQKILLGEASWFVAALIVAEVLLVFSMFITKGNKLILFSIAVISAILAFIIGNKHSASPIFNPHNFWYINDALLALSFMICGYLYRQYQHIFHSFHNPLSTLLLLLVAIGLKIIIFYTDATTVIGSINVSSIPLFLADVTADTLFLLSVCRYIHRQNIITWTGSRSLVYYFFCGAVPMLVSTILNRIGFTYHAYWQVLLAFILVYIICSALAFTIYRYLPTILGKH